jgi:hypothetical protein
MNDKLQLIFEILSFLLRHYISTAPATNTGGTAQAREFLEKIEYQVQLEKNREEVSS